jgi:hypothetical protein
MEEEGEATQQRNNATVKLKPWKKSKINKNTKWQRRKQDRDPPDSQPNAHLRSKFNSTEQLHMSYLSFMWTAPLGQIGRKQERVIKNELDHC